MTKPSNVCIFIDKHEGNILNETTYNKPGNTDILPLFSTCL